jgi:apolipoprotein N-acyltransferase
VSKLPPDLVNGIKGTPVPLRVQGRALALLAFVLGLLSAAALPPVDFVPVLLLAVPGLLALIGKRGVRGAVWMGFCFGFGHHLIGLYWITDAILIEAAAFWWLVPLAVPALAAILALFIAVPCGVARLAPAGWRRVLVFAGAWVLADLARQFVATGFPWNPWGSVWEIAGPVGDVFIQPAAWIGVHGLTLLTVLLAATPALGRRGMAAGAVALVAWAGFGVWRLSGPPPEAPGLTVVLVQGNIAEGHKFDAAYVREIFQRHLDLTRRGVEQAGSGPAVVVWPETSSPYLLETDANARAAIEQAAGVPGLIGALRFDAEQRPRNSLIALAGAGPPVAVYDKWHLVPFGEYQPGWVPLAGLMQPGDGLAPGPGPRTMHVPGLPAIGPLICYEAIFSGEIVDPRERPDWLVNVTNDAWFGDSSGPRQHLAAARMRAVEEGLPLVRAANTGISAAFDAFGREQARLGMEQAGVVVTKLPGHLPPTLFSRLGLVEPTALAILAVAIGWLWPTRRTRGSPKSDGV